MIIFPAWVSHQVRENRSQTERMSLSMNAKLMPIDKSQPWRGVIAGFDRASG